MTPNTRPRHQLASPSGPLTQPGPAMERPSIATSHLPVDGEPPRATDRGRLDVGRSDYRSEPSSARSSHRTSDASRTMRHRSTRLRRRSTAAAAREPLSASGPLVTSSPSATASVPGCHHSRRATRRGSAATRPVPRPAPAHLFAAHSPSHPCRHRRNRLRQEPARSESASCAQAQTAPPRHHLPRLRKTWRHNGRSCRTCTCGSCHSPPSNADLGRAPTLDLVPGPACLRSQPAAPHARERHGARRFTRPHSQRRQRHRQLPRGWERVSSIQGGIGSRRTTARRKLIARLLLLRLSRAARAMARRRHSRPRKHRRTRDVPASASRSAPNHW